MTPTTEQAAPGKIYKQMALIMADVGPVAKDRRNTQQGYSFRGVDDVYQALQVIMAKHGVFSLPTVLSDRTEDRTTKGGAALIYRVLTIKYSFYAEDGSSVDAVVVGEGMDSGDKATNKAMSVADKYCLLQAFKVPTDEAKDPENDSPEPEPKATQQTKPPPAKTAEAVLYDNTTQDLRNALQNAAKNNGITRIEDLSALGKHCIGTDMRELQAKVKAWADKNRAVDSRI